MCKTEPGFQEFTVQWEMQPGKETVPGMDIRSETESRDEVGPTLSEDMASGTHHTGGPRGRPWSLNGTYQGAGG